MKWWKQQASWMPFRGGGTTAAPWRRVDLGTSFLTLLKDNAATEQRPQEQSHTPCAHQRGGGFVNHTISNAQQSCVLATALGVWLFVNRMRSENIELWCSGDRRYWFFVLCHGDRKYWFLVLRGQKRLIFGAPGFGAPGTENIDFWCSWERKYWFLVLQEQKILIFGAPK